MGVMGHCKRLCVNFLLKDNFLRESMITDDLVLNFSRRHNGILLSFILCILTLSFVDVAFHIA